MTQAEEQQLSSTELVQVDDSSTDMSRGTAVADNPPVQVDDSNVDIVPLQQLKNASAGMHLAHARCNLQQSHGCFAALQAGNLLLRFGAIDGDSESGDAGGQAVAAVLAGGGHLCEGLYSHCVG